MFTQDQHHVLLIERGESGNSASTANESTTEDEGGTLSRRQKRERGRTKTSSHRVRQNLSSRGSGVRADSSSNLTTASSSANSVTTSTVLNNIDVRRSASCRRPAEYERPFRSYGGRTSASATAGRIMTSHHNLMSMSMIGNSVGGTYEGHGGLGGGSGGEATVTIMDAFERRRKARSNDFLDRYAIFTC